MKIEIKIDTEKIPANWRAITEAAWRQDGIPGVGHILNALPLHAWLFAIEWSVETERGVWRDGHLVEGKP